MEGLWTDPYRNKTIMEVIDVLPGTVVDGHRWCKVQVTLSGQGR